MLVTGSLHFNYRPMKPTIINLTFTIKLLDYQAMNLGQRLFFHLDNYCLETVKLTSGCEVWLTVTDVYSNDHRTITNKRKAVNVFFFVSIIHVSTLN